MTGALPPDEHPGRRRFPPLPSWAGPATRLVHGGHRPERNAGALVPPIYQSSTFHYPAESSESAAEGNLYLYSRYENPSQEVAAEIVRELEGGASARVFASGMAAISTTLLALARPGEEILAQEDLYGGTVALLTHHLPQYGYRVRWMTRAEASEPERCLRPETRLVMLESPSNPTLAVVDLARWAEAARARGAVTVIDNTFATPINQRPLALGIDVAVHSATKYLGGHSDLIAGAVVGPVELLERIRALHLLLGGSLDPFAAFLLARGMKTLGVRVARQSATAAWLARELAGRREVGSVYYPGADSPGSEAIARRQMTGRGGVLTISLRGGERAARELLRHLRIVQPAASLGGVESLASLPIETSHRALSKEQLMARGIDAGMVRLSIGLEEPEDLLRDLTEAMSVR